VNDRDRKREHWRKSTFSGIGECVEVRARAAQILVRSSKDPGGTTLDTGHPAFAAWIAGIKLGDLDDLIAI
jgi:hypothetical protein